MPGVRPAGALIYAKDFQRLSAFYRDLLGMTKRDSDSRHQVIENADHELTIHEIPLHIANAFTISTPPVPRDESPIKLYFTVPSLEAVKELVRRNGGLMFGDVERYKGLYTRHGYDCEGNIFQLRAPAP